MLEGMGRKAALDAEQQQQVRAWFRKGLVVDEVWKRAKAAGWTCSRSTIGSYRPRRTAPDPPAARRPASQGPQAASQGPQAFLPPRDDLEAFRRALAVALELAEDRSQEALVRLEGCDEVAKLLRARPKEEAPPAPTDGRFDPLAN